MKQESLDLPPGPCARGGRAASAWLLAVCLAGLSFALQGHIQINLADEGYLWYGAWRTAHGEIPMRDFIAYCPGRYYWIAAWSLLFGQGILGLRAAVAVFQALGLALGLLALQRAVRSLRWLVPAGVLLLVWMFPRHKLFEHVISLAAVYVALLLIEKPALGRHVAAGAFAGLSVFFGLNHGLYNVVAFVLLTLLIWFKTDRRQLFERFVALGGGLLLGALPSLFMLLFVPGFFRRVFDYLMLLAHFGSTNLPLPVPWPWRQLPLPADVVPAAAALSLGLMFMILPAFYLWGGAWLLFSRRGRMKETPLICAAIVIGGVWMHHAFARPDPAHLAQAIEPFLIGAIALPAVMKHGWARRTTVAGVACVALMSLFLVVGPSPFYDKAVAHPENYVRMEIDGDSLWLRRHNARMIRAVMDADAELIPRRDSLLIACHLPGLYPMVQRTSPLWDFYLIPVNSEELQRRQIATLEEKRVGWLLLNDMTIDGRDDLRFRNSHPLLWKYFMDNFEPVPFDPLPEGYWLMKRIE